MSLFVLAVAQSKPQLPFQTSGNSSATSATAAHYISFSFLFSRTPLFRKSLLRRR